MPFTGPVEALVRRARWRCLLSSAVEHSAWAASAALAALLALLVAGTQILDWYWLPAAALLGLVAAVFGLRQRIPSAYRTAQLVDRNLGTEDAVSTAFYFGSLAPEQSVSGELRQAQHRAASDLARVADVRRAAPIRLPRALYLTLSLTVCAGALFGWRYGVTRSLNLRPPLVNLAFDTFRVTPVRESTLRKTPAQRLIDEQLEKLGIPANEPTTRASANETSDNASRPTRAPDGDLTAPQDEHSSAEASEQGEGSDDANGERATDASPRDGAAQEQPPAGASAKGPKAPPEQSNPLLDKLRDAMANLLAKMKVKPPPGLPTRAGGSQVGQKGKGQQASRSEKGSPGPGEQSAEGAERADARGAQPGEGEQSAQAGKGQASARGPQQPSSQDGKSGIGRQDGDKALRDAAQLAAMGKLSEILGRRSAEIGGEIMVEVKSGTQDLKTTYSQTSAAHTDSGGQIHRDEIPLLYQPYVEQYFEQVHKAPPKK